VDRLRAVLSPQTAGLKSEIGDCARLRRVGFDHMFKRDSPPMRALCDRLSASRHRGHRAAHQRRRNQQGARRAPHPRPVAAQKHRSSPSAAARSRRPHRKEATTNHRPPSPAQTAKHRGFFEQTKGGTIFLDEVTGCRWTCRSSCCACWRRYLRALGTTDPIPTDVRIMRPPAARPGARREGKFREDLYHRLNVFPITLPPCASAAPIEMLAQHSCAAEPHRRHQQVVLAEALAQLYETGVAEAACASWRTTSSAPAATTSSRAATRTGRADRRQDRQPHVVRVGTPLGGRRVTMATLSSAAASAPAARIRHQPQSALQPARGLRREGSPARAETKPDAAGRGLKPDSKPGDGGGHAGTDGRARARPGWNLSHELGGGDSCVNKTHAHLFARAGRPCARSPGSAGSAPGCASTGWRAGARRARGRARRRARLGEQVGGAAGRRAGRLPILRRHVAAVAQVDRRGQRGAEQQDLRE
jgi:hypothetical protein